MLRTVEGQTGSGVGGAWVSDGCKAAVSAVDDLCRLLNKGEIKFCVVQALVTLGFLPFAPELTCN